MSQDLAILSGIVLGTGIFLWLARRRDSSRLPPNFRFSASPFEHRAPWEIYKEWGESCGNALIHLSLHRSDVVVVNDASVARELLEGRWPNYSSRPQFHMMNHIGRQNNVVVQQYGPRLRTARRLIHDTFSARKSENWMPVVQRESVEFLSALLSNPEDFKRSIQRFVGTFMVRLTYGQELDADYLHLVDKVGEHTVQAATAGKWWMNSYPVLKYYPAWAPGGGFQRWAEEARKIFHEFTSKPLNLVKEQLRNSPGDVPYSFIHKNLATLTVPDPEMESIISGTAASLYSAAVETTTSILMTFLLIMITHPQIQAKASAEICAVVGQDRLPSLEDAAELPYIEALIKELHRYHPPVSLLTRSASKLDEYEGYSIPQNAWVLTNIWGITHDGNEYVDPLEFNPERYLQGQPGYKDSTLARDPRDFTFGIGRRRCPGMPIANAAIYLAVTGILASFSIGPPTDQGKKLIPAIEFTKSTISSPVGFRCLIQPRHGGVMNLIEHARFKNVQ